MSRANISRRRGVTGTAAILACGLAASVALPRPAAAQSERTLTEKDVREIVREELEHHREAIEKLIEEKLASHPTPFAFEGHGDALVLKGMPGVPSIEGLFAGKGGWLGVQVSDADGGALIDEVVADSPAAKAGLSAGDLIVRVGDSDVGSSSDLVEAISSKAPGTKLKVVVQRDGDEKGFSVKLGARQEGGFTFATPSVPGDVAHEHEKAVKAEKEAKAGKPAKAAKKAAKAEASEEGENASARTASGPGFLGVEYAPGPEGHGTVVTGVVDGSPAEKAGIGEGDVIHSINGTEVTADTLPEVISSLGAGSRVKVKLSRDGEEETLVLRLGTREPGGAMAETGEVEATETAPEPPAALRAPAKAEKPSEPKPGFLGVETRSIDADARETLGLDADQGVLVQRVVEDSAAEKAGLQRNDLIVSVNGKSIGTPDALGEAVRAIGAGQTANLSLIRKGNRMNLEVVLGGRD